MICPSPSLRSWILYGYRLSIERLGSNVPLDWLPTLGNNMRAMRDGRVAPSRILLLVKTWAMPRLIQRKSKFLHRLHVCRRLYLATPEILACRPSKTFRSYNLPLPPVLSCSISTGIGGLCFSTRTIRYPPYYTPRFFSLPT